MYLSKQISWLVWIPISVNLNSANWSYLNDISPNIIYLHLLVLLFNQIKLTFPTFPLSSVTPKALNPCHQTLRILVELSIERLQTSITRMKPPKFVSPWKPSPRNRNEQRTRGRDLWWRQIDAQTNEQREQLGLSWRNIRQVFGRAALCFVLWEIATFPVGLESAWNIRQRVARCSCIRSCKAQSLAGERVNRRTNEPPRLFVVGRWRLKRE